MNLLATIFLIFAVSQNLEGKALEASDSMEFSVMSSPVSQLVRRRRAEARLFSGSHCEYIQLCDIAAMDKCQDGTKFVIKQESGVRKQFLILNSSPILAFVRNGVKFTACSSFTEVTLNIDCKAVAGLGSVDLAATAPAGSASSLDAVLGKRMNLTHAAHAAYGYVELVTATTVRLTQLYYDGAGPKTNWIVGTKSSIGVDSDTVIIDGLTASGEALYPDPTDLSSAVPSLPAYDNNSILLTLPIKQGKQMTWSDVSWIALYCRQVSMLFMSARIPESFGTIRGENES